MDTAEFKQAMSNLASGVSVISTLFDGHLFGFTASSLTSVSLNPPLILFCLNQNAGSLFAFKNSPSFGVSILSENQADISKHFASPAVSKDGAYKGSETKFDEQSYNSAPSKIESKMSSEIAQASLVRGYMPSPASTDAANLEALENIYTADTSKVARKMSGEFAQASLVRGYMPSPASTDTANLEVSKLYIQGIWSRCPLILDSLCWIECKKVDMYQAGDHFIFIGEVMTSHLNYHQDRSPLVYFNKHYHKITSIL